MAISNLDRKFWLRVSLVIVKEFLTYGVHISNDLDENDESSHRAFTAPAMFNPLHFINNLQYFEGD